MSTRRILLQLALALGVGLLAPIGDARADDAQEARKIVQGISDNALNILQRPNRADRHREFLKLFTSNFNTVAIGRFVLGRYRDGTSPKQFDSFMAVFQELVAKTYTVQLGDFAGEKFKVLSSRSDNKRWVVDSQIEPPGRSSIRLDWVLARTKSGLKVVDVRVDNLSMAITQRDEFSSVLQQNNGSVDKLIDFMRQKIRRLDASV
jgi:phospholipid transport system substrate-binding protein